MNQMKIADYFRLFHGRLYMYMAHFKFNASNTPKEEITLSQVNGMRGPRPITSFTHQSGQMRDVGRTCMGLP